jgi:mersacidin/lichenicidin family type 2 lantibiotic
MKTHTVIRAWKDEEYRLGLSNGERSRLPEHPAGAIELTDAELGGAAGGTILYPSFACPSWMCPSVGLPCLPSGQFSCRCLPF